MSEEMNLLLPFESYEENAVNIGTQQKSADMARFIERVREDGLYLLDVNMTDSRIRSIAEFLNKYDAPRIMVVSARQYGQRPARKFAQTIGAMRIVGRFIPGTLTNSRLRTYIEPEVIVVTDPAADQQALTEAVSSGLPVVAICDANNRLRNVDLALPANNKGRRSLALVYWLLSREMMKIRGVINDADWERAQDVMDWESTF